MYSILKKSQWAMILLCSMLFMASCNNDDDSVPLTILQTHQANLKNVSVNGDNIAYLEYGSGDKVIILLHGLPTSSLLFRNVVEQIANNTDFRVIVPDMLGFGESDKPNRAESYTVTAQAQWVYDFASALSINNFVLGLHDSGGFVGWAMLTHSNASRLNGLLITDTTLEFDGVSPAPPMVPIFAMEKTPTEVWDPVDEDPALAEEVARGFLENGFHDDSKLTQELVDAYVAPMNESTQVYIGVFETIGPILADPTAIKTAMANFNKPVAIVWGKEDVFLDATIIPQKLQADLSVPASRLTIIEGAGHYLQEDKPTEYINAVSTFLNEDF